MNEVDVETFRKNQEQYFKREESGKAQRIHILHLP
jgi:hypothetical protein